MHEDSAALVGNEDSDSCSGSRAVLYLTVSSTHLMGRGSVRARERWSGDLRSEATDQ